jgi:hypothetical protein
MAVRRRWLALSARSVGSLRIVGASCALAACVGAIGDSPGPDGLDALGDGGAQIQALCKSISPGLAPLRRLTQSEYNNTVRDLLGDTSNPASAFPPDQKVGDFSNTAVALTVSPLLAQSYETAAEELAATAVGNLATLSSCDTTVTGETPCATQFIQTFGQRAFRRPVSQDEQTALLTLYQTNRAGADYKNGIQAVIEAMLQSAPFLYRPELGVAGAASGGVVPLTSYEMASRLSYFFWGSMPDATLFTAAAADQLRSPAQIATQATRLLADAKAQPAVRQFFGEWLGVDSIANSPKDPKTYPEYTSDVRTAMQQETLAFVDWVMWKSDAKLATLLTAPVSFLNPSLAQFYGVTGVAGLTGTTFQQVQLDATQRAGIVTQGAVMAILAKPDRSSPVLRGKFVREQLLCQTISPPPQNIVITPPAVMPGVSTRELFSMHATVQPCKGCHSLMDPVGFGFENYDGVGRWRTVDQGHPVDASGTLTASDVNGSFNGAVDLAHKLAQSQEVSDCMAVEWFRYAMGRGETTDDACTLQSLKQGFATNHGNIRDLLVAVTQTDAFRYRPVIQ